MPAIQLTLLSKPGCHLCDDARQVVTDVLAVLPRGSGDEPVVLEEKSILDDERLLDEYVEEIPVVLINGRVHTVWRVDPARLTAALTAELAAAPTAELAEEPTAEPTAELEESA